MAKNGSIPAALEHACITLGLQCKHVEPYKNNGNKLFKSPPWYSEYNTTTVMYAFVGDFVHVYADIIIRNTAMFKSLLTELSEVKGLNYYEYDGSLVLWIKPVFN